MPSRNKTIDEVLILYVNSFKTKEMGLDLDGHLIKGSIYLCLKQTENSQDGRSIYRIYFDDSKKTKLDGIFIKSLNENNESWECDLEELDFKNIDKYELTNNDLNYAIDLTLLSPEAVKEKMDKDGEDSGLTIFQKLDQAHGFARDDDMDELDREIYDTAIDDMKESAPESKNDLRDVLDDVIEYVGSTFGDKYANSSINTMDMLMSDEHGKSASIFNAVKYLSRYATSGYTKSDNPQDLMKSIHYILIELNRVKHLNL